MPRFRNGTRIVLVLRSCDSAANGGRQAKREALLVRQPPAPCRTRWTDGRRRSLNQIRNGLARNESAASNRDACQLPGPKELIDRVPGNAAQELPGFLDGVQSAVLHGSLVPPEGSHRRNYWPLCPVLTVDSPRRKHCVRLAEKESGVFGEFAQILEQVSRVIGSKKRRYCRKLVKRVGVARICG